MQTFVFISKYFCNSFGTKKVEWVKFVAWTPDTTEIVHAVYWVSSGHRYSTSLLSKLRCMVNVLLSFLQSCSIYQVCHEHSEFVRKTSGQGWTSGRLLWNVRTGTGATLSGWSEIIGAGSADADAHQHKSPSLGSWNVTFHT